MAHLVVRPGEVGIHFLLETRQISRDLHNYAIMYMVRHEAEREHLYIVSPGKNAVVSKVNKIITYAVKQKHPILCSLVAVIQDR